MKKNNTSSSINLLITSVALFLDWLIVEVTIAVSKLQNNHVMAVTVTLIGIVLLITINIYILILMSKLRRKQKGKKIL